MKVLFVWSGLSGYMGDCWRELAGKECIELKVSVDAHSGLPELLPESQPVPLAQACAEGEAVVCRRRRANVGFDGFRRPWEWRLRKIAARFVLWRYLRRFDAAFVNGVSAARYARWLGFGKARIYKGLIATNIRRFGPHKGGGGFLYVGRESSEKGLDVLRAAHARYRERGGTWPLRIVNGVPPDALGPIYAAADCFVLASRYEPWGVVLVEAAAAGLPIICTDACGARHEVVSGNGIVVKVGDVAAFADAMWRMGNGEWGTVNGELGRELAKPYSCEAWAERVEKICEELCDA